MPPHSALFLSPDNLHKAFSIDVHLEQTRWHERLVERCAGRVRHACSPGALPSRGGVRQWTMSLADDWGQYGVTVNCLAPGWFKTAQNAVMYDDPEWVHYLKEKIPLSHLTYMFDAAHGIEIDQPERMLRLVTAFLERGEAFQLLGLGHDAHTERGTACRGLSRDRDHHHVVSLHRHGAGLDGALACRLQSPG